MGHLDVCLGPAVSVQRPHRHLAGRPRSPTRILGPTSAGSSAGATCSFGEATKNGHPSPANQLSACSHPWSAPDPTAPLPASERGRPPAACLPVPIPGGGSAPWQIRRAPGREAHHWIVQQHAFDSGDRGDSAMRLESATIRNGFGGGCRWPRARRPRVRRCLPASACAQPHGPRGCPAAAVRARSDRHPRPAACRRRRSAAPRCRSTRSSSLLIIWGIVDTIRRCSRPAPAQERSPPAAAATSKTADTATGDTATSDAPPAVRPCGDLFADPDEAESGT